MNYTTELKQITEALNQVYEKGGRRQEWIKQSNPEYWKPEYRHQASHWAKCRIVSCKDFIDTFKTMGYHVDKPYHAHGIGNNNAYKITKRILLEGEYETEVIIGEFNYNYDLYNNHVFVSFYDKDNNKIYINDKVYHS